MTQELTYTEVNGYLIPDLALPEGPEYKIGIWGQRRFDYLKQHKSVLFTQLIIKQMMEAQGVTEQMKADDVMLWLGKVNNIYACADEIIRAELICA